MWTSRRERVGMGLVAGSASSRPPELARVQRWRRAKETALPELTLPWVPLEEALVQALPGYWLVPPPTEDLAPVRRAMAKTPS